MNVVAVHEIHSGGQSSLCAVFKGHYENYLYIVKRSICRTEKNATAWSQEKLKSLLEGLKIENDDCKYDF